MATQALSEFAGESCACKWTPQMHNISKIYGVGGKFEKMLMVSKIKGKAYKWLHANSDRVLLPLDDLTAELISSKLEIRRKFEGRKWKQSESFGSYVDDKIMLAQGINIDADEMLSCIIEGIPNQELRNQAHIQCFVDIGHIKRAFADVSLPKSYRVGRKTTSTDPKDSKKTRCFNCNAKGHWTFECRKSKREKGSCYACGKRGHFVAKCLKNKNKNEGENNYVRYVEINFVNESNTRLIAECLIDTGIQSTQRHFKITSFKFILRFKQKLPKNVWKKIMLCYEKFI